MDAESLSQLLEVSHAVGGRPEIVQGGGGNTSVKSPDARTMAVKASGTSLADMSESAGWAELDLAVLLGVFEIEGLAGRGASDRERRVLKHQDYAVLGGPGGRPSVESALHALLGRVVLHTHPVAINALTCGPGEAALADLVRAGEAPPLWVPYTDPGYTLAAAVRDAIATYQAEHAAPPQVLLLENHGIFVSAESAKGCIDLHEEWHRRCAAYFDETASPLSPMPEPDPADVSRTMARIRRAVHDADGGPVAARLSTDPELAHAASDPSVRDVLAAGALSPDQIVYTGAHAAIADDLDDVPPTVVAARAEAAPPRVVLVRNVGAVLLSQDPGRLDVVETMAASAARTICLANGRGGARNLRPEAAEFIMDWEVEYYRAGVLAGETGRLSHQVAVVTGAASGLGLGIARGLVAAGAAVALCDIDEAGLEAAVESVCEPARALPVTMDVTDEGAVREGFEAIVRHWGGVDLVVCAAGIAPPYELVDFPVDAWRRALEVNLTGYLLVAREGARILRAQGHGGAMVIVSSKSGLEASKANSAYNATKAGELHLMRGWALELGADGIRVNAVAPGNVFEGSKIWNPEYIQVCAEKKGIQPEDVIPYYVNLTALKREIKRDDVAAAVVFLCSDDARCITGHTLVIDSGQVMVR